MAGAVQYAAFLLMSLTVAELKHAGISHGSRCVPQPPCFDLLLVERMAQHISKDVIADESENILLKRRTFDKIRKKKYLHSCVLEEIIDFYENVLSKSADRYISPGLNYQHELLSMMGGLRRCTYKMKNKCEELYQKAAQHPMSETSEADMTPKEAAILQLQKLSYASERLNDMSIQERAMDELKTLHHYMPGKGFRKTNDSIKTPTRAKL